MAAYVKDSEFKEVDHLILKMFAKSATLGLARELILIAVVFILTGKRLPL